MKTSELSNQIRKWCKEDGIFIQSKKIPGDSFRIIVEAPKGSKRMVEIYQPSDYDDKIVVVAAVNVSPNHSQKMRELSAKKRQDFILEMLLLLGNRPTEFNMNHPDGVIESIVNSAEIYVDGLKKDRLFEAIREVNKSKLLAIWKVQQKFGVTRGKKDEASDSAMFR